MSRLPCWYCGNKIKPEHQTRDHVFPRVRGGVGNTVMACIRCNRKKGGLALSEYRLLALGSANHLFPGEREPIGRPSIFAGIPPSREHGRWVSVFAEVQELICR